MEKKTPKVHCIPKSGAKEQIFFQLRKYLAKKSTFLCTNNLVLCKKMTFFCLLDPENHTFTTFRHHEKGFHISKEKKETRNDLSIR